MENFQENTAPEQTMPGAYWKINEKLKNAPPEEKERALEWGFNNLNKIYTYLNKLEKEDRDLFDYFELDFIKKDCRKLLDYIQKDHSEFVDAGLKLQDKTGSFYSLLLSFERIKKASGEEKELRRKEYDTMIRNKIQKFYFILKETLSLSKQEASHNIH